MTEYKEPIVSQSRVLKALISMEDELFNRNSGDDPTKPVPVRMAWLFAQAYIKNYYPEESIILIESYELLQKKGYYYNIE